MSGVVYNDDMVMKAVVLCSEKDDTLHVDLLLGTVKKEPQFIMAALQGMLRKLQFIGGEDVFRSITMIGANAITETILKRVLDSAYEAKLLGETHHAAKTVEEAPPADVVEEIDESKENAWREEGVPSPIQGNAVWKMMWTRERQE